MLTDEKQQEVYSELYDSIVRGVMSIFDALIDRDEIDNAVKNKIIQGVLCSLYSWLATSTNNPTEFIDHIHSTVKHNVARYMTMTDKEKEAFSEMRQQKGARH